MISFLVDAFTKAKEEKGESLVSVMIAIGISGILAMVFATMHQNNQKMMKKTQLDQELVEIRGMFSSKMPCLAKSCSEFKMKVDSYRIGNWHFQCTCQGNDVLILTRKYTNDHTTPIQDPLHKKEMDWKPLYTAAGNGFYCTLTIVNPSVSNTNTPGTSNTSTPGTSQSTESSPAATPEIEGIPDIKIENLCPAGKSITIDPETFQVSCQ